MSAYIQSINVFDIGLPASKIQSKTYIPLTSPNLMKKHHTKGFSFSLDKHVKLQKSHKSSKKSVYINNAVEIQILSQIDLFKQKIKQISFNYKMDQKICFQFVNKMLNGLGIQCQFQKRQKQKSISALFPGSYQKIQRLQQLLIEKEYQISLLQQKLDIINQQFSVCNNKKECSQIFQNKKLIQATDIKVHLKSSQTLQQNLYYQAKMLDLAQFVDLCGQVLLRQKPHITNIHSLKNQQLQKTNTFLKEIHEKVFLISQNLLHVNTPNNIALSKTIVGKSSKTISEQIQEISALLKDLNKLHNINSMIFSCSQPCCRIKDVYDQRFNKAKLIMQLRDNPKRHNYYKTDSSQQYFDRYYKKANFDATKIFSLQKTKTQEMQHLETMYRKRKSKTRHLSNLNQRQSKSTFQI